MKLRQQMKYKNIKITPKNSYQYHFQREIIKAEKIRQAIKREQVIRQQQLLKMQEIHDNGDIFLCNIL